MSIVSWRRCVRRSSAIDAGFSTLLVHYRMARDSTAAKQQLQELFTAFAPEVSVIAGEHVFPLLPPDACNKEGAAPGRLCEASGAFSALYVGDDVSDEDIVRLCRED